MTKTRTTMWILTVLFSLGLAACAGSGDNGGGIDDDDTEAAAAIAYLIDDFDDGDDMVIGGHAYWYVYGDEATAGWTTTPAMGQDPSTGMTHVTAETDPGPAAIAGTNVNYFHFTGTGISTWGPAVHTNLINVGDLGMPVDVSAYEGLQFYARGTGRMRVTADTIDISTEHGCAPEADCYNQWGQTLNLTSDWQLYQISFATMTQEEGWGAAIPFDLTEVFGVTFSYVFEAGTDLPDFQMDIDHVGFYNGPAFDAATTAPTISGDVDTSGSEDTEPTDTEDTEPTDTEDTEPADTEDTEPADTDTSTDDSDTSA